MSEPELICERRGAAGCVLLNRPKALNALTPGMVAGLAAALDAWERDPAVERVVVRGAGERAFCAGGDIRLIHDLGKAGDHAAQMAFWRDEYRLNARIARYPKPYVSLIDGIVMGGGVGVSAHGSRRVAGDRYSFAMPEVSIGFFPDVGASYFLPRLPGQAGVWLALTGARIGAGDACSLGLATHFCPSGEHAALAEALCGRGDTDVLLARFAAPAPPPKFSHARGVIDACFARASVAEIIAALEAAGGDFAAETLATLAGKSPTSLVLTLRQMREGARLALPDVLRMEYRIVWRVCRGREFQEGVRAAIIDRDNRPSWSPARLEDVRAADIEACFAPLGADELALAAT